MKKLAFAFLGLIVLSSSAMAGQTTKPPVVDVIDFDRVLTDSCYMSNCGSVPVAPSAYATVAQQRSALSTFTILQPSYTPPASCTTLLNVADNAWQTILTGPANVGTSGRLDLTLNSEPRIQRLNASTIPGVGAIGVRLFVLPATDPDPGNIAQSDPRELLNRWVLHENVNNTLITSNVDGTPLPTPPAMGSNVNGVNQPIISTSSIRRFLTLAPGSYNVWIQAKWSARFTALRLEPGTSGFIASGGGRGALICVPQVTLETWN